MVKKGIYSQSPIPQNLSDLSYPHAVNLNSLQNSTQIQHL